MRVDNMPPESPQPIVVPTPVENSVPVAPPPPIPEVPPAPKKNILKMVLAIVLGLLLLLIVALGVKTLISKAGKTTKQTELVWWGLWENEAIVKPLIEEYQSKNPKIKIRYILNSPQDYRERLASAMSKGTAPDIFRFHNTWVPMLVRDLDPIPTSIMAAADFANTYYPVMSTDVLFGKNLYGIPLGYDALTLFINDEIFAQAKLTAPKTWVELRETAKKLTKIENDVIVRSGVALGSTKNVEHWQEILGLMLTQNKVNLVKPEGKKAEDVLKYFCVFSTTDGVWDDTFAPSTIAFANGKVAMYFGPSWRALNIKELNPDLRFTIVSLPQLPKEDPSEPDVAYATYWLDGVWNKSKNKTAAWDFLKFISSKESLTKMFQTASTARGFGEAYPRADMNQMLLDNPALGPIIKLAPAAKSWYLASRTFDGATGINSQMNKYFEDALNAVCKGTLPSKAMESLTPGVAQILKQYGLTK